MMQKLKKQSILKESGIEHTLEYEFKNEYNTLDYQS
jgi:hypothetical protein